MHVQQSSEIEGTAQLVVTDMYLRRVEMIDSFSIETKSDKRLAKKDPEEKVETQAKIQRHNGEKMNGNEKKIK